jgi:hypothetical protein
MWFARYGRRVPVVLHVLDLWPDSAHASGFLGTGRAASVMSRAMAGWCDAMYRSAAKIAYISPGVGDLLARRGVAKHKLVHIPMWADESPVAPTGDMRAELGLNDDQIALVYAGTMGQAQGLDALLDAVATVTDPRLVVLLAGSGLAEGRLRHQVEHLGLRNARFLGRLPAEQMPALLRAGDLHVVSLSPSSMSPYTMPSKVQSILAASRAMLMIADGDAADVAMSSAIQDACGLGREKLDLLGRCGRDFYDREYSLATGVRRVESALKEAAESRRQR